MMDATESVGTLDENVRVGKMLVMNFAGMLGFDDAWLRDFFKRNSLTRYHIASLVGVKKVCAMIAFNYCVVSTMQEETHEPEPELDTTG